MKVDLRIDCKCWICGIYKEPDKIYQPLICVDCLPKYKEQKFVFVRPSQEELDDIFSTNIGFTCR